MADDDRTAEASDDGSASVELDLYDLSVRVEGGSEDDLDEVEESATDLMEYLVDKHYDLEKGPDDRDRF